MDGIGPDSLAKVYDLLGVQETFDRPWTNHIGLIGFLDVDTGRVGFGIDGRGCDDEFTAGSDNPHRNFATISNQNLLEHTRSYLSIHPAFNRGGTVQKRAYASIGSR